MHFAPWIRLRRSPGWRIHVHMYVFVGLVKIFRICLLFQKRCYESAMHFQTFQWNAQVHLELVREVRSVASNTPLIQTRKCVQFYIIVKVTDSIIQIMEGMDLLILTLLGWIYQTTAESELCGMYLFMI